jgi:hypothetical protein
MRESYHQPSYHKELLTLFGGSSFSSKSLTRNSRSDLGGIYSISPSSSSTSPICPRPSTANSFNPSVILSKESPSSHSFLAGVVNCGAGTGASKGNGKGVRDCLDRLGLDADGSGVVNCLRAAGRETLAGVFVDFPPPPIVWRFPNDFEGMIECDVLANSLLGPGCQYGSILQSLPNVFMPSSPDNTTSPGCTNICLPIHDTVTLTPSFISRQRPSSPDNITSTPGQEPLTNIIHILPLPLALHLPLNSPQGPGSIRNQQPALSSSTRCFTR